MNDADLRLTIEGDVLGVVSAHGGERIVAGPPMYQLVQELTDLVLKWRVDQVAASPAAPRQGVTDERDHSRTQP